MAVAARNEVFRQINRVRREHGLRRLKWSPLLAKSAMAAAKEVERDRGPLKHHARWWLKIYKAAGRRRFGGIGEIIGEGQDTAAEIVRGWMNSPTHRARILDGDYTHAGVGQYQDSWATHFGGR